MGLPYNFYLTYIFSVPEESANPEIGEFILLSEDHFHICKPKDKTSESYLELQKFITKLVSKKTSRPQAGGQEHLQNDLLLSSCIL